MSAHPSFNSATLLSVDETYPMAFSMMTGGTRFNSATLLSVDETTTAGAGENRGDSFNSATLLSVDETLDDARNIITQAMLQFGHASERG